MTSTSQPDAARSAAIRSMLIDTVDRSEARRPARRAVLFTSIATASVLVIGGLGVTISRITAPAPGHGVVVGPSPEPTLPATVTPTPGSPSGPGIVDPAGTPSPVPVVPDPAPTPTPTVDLSDPGSWRITFDGIGPIREDQDMVTAFASLSGYATLEDGSGNFCLIRSKQLPEGVSLILVPVEKKSPLGAVKIAVFGVYDQTVVTPAQAAESPRTQQGIGLGATLTEVRAAYPGLIDLGIGTNGRNYGVRDSRGHLIVFEAGSNGIVSSITAGASDETWSFSMGCG